MGLSPFRKAVLRQSRIAAMDDTHDDASGPLGLESEINELLGLFDVPAFVRRGQDLEHALARLHTRCQRERDERLEMVRMRLRQWAAVAAGPDLECAVFAEPIAYLWVLTGLSAVEWTKRPAPGWRQRGVARDLAAAVVRFNDRWRAFLAEMSLDVINRMIDQYNRFYVLEKECSLGSPKLAARHFVPKPSVTREALEARYPLLPVPELAGARRRNSR